MNMRRLLWLVTIVLAWMTAMPSAHDEHPAPVINVRLVTSGSSLDVTASIPSRALADRTLPRDSDGRLIGSGLDDALRLVARDLVNSLELRQGSEPLPSPTIAVNTIENGATVRFELGYLVRPGANRLSVRVAPYRGLLDIVPVEVEFVEPGANVRRYRIESTPERILLQPTLVDAALEFTTRGARLLISRWEIVLFALVLSLPSSLPVTSARQGLPLLLAGQIIGAVIAVFAPPATAGPAIAVFGASVLLVAAIHRLMASLTGPSRQAARAQEILTVVFGLSAGFGIGATLGQSLPFAGEHVVVALLTASAVILLGQWWLWSLYGVGLRLASRYGIPERAILVAGAIFVAHEATHAIAEQALAPSQQFGLSRDHLIEILTVLWLAALLLASTIDRRVRA